MSCKSEKIRLRGLQDRRRKLEDYQYDEIKHKYATGLYSLRNLATEYKVDKKLIQIIVNPEAKQKNDEYIKNHWRNYIGSRKERNEAARKTRRYKQELYLKGELKG